MAALIESRPKTNGCTVIIARTKAHLRTLSILYCSLCRRVRVASWPDWKLENAKLISGTFPAEWEMEWRNCRRCESKGHSEEAYELDPSSLIEKWIIADIDMGQGNARQSDDECNMHVSWYTGQGFTFLTLDEERGLEPTSVEGFEYGYDFQQYLIQGEKEVCVTVVSSFCEVCGKARFDCEGGTVQSGLAIAQN